MQPGTWIGKFWTRIKSGIIQDVPPSLEQCETCREVNCTHERWSSCASRLAVEAEHYESLGVLAPSATGRTNEMPGVFDADETQTRPSDTATKDPCCDQRKRASSSGV